MFTSIRWKLTVSYIILTILTVALVGFLFFTTVQVRTAAMESDYLRETADSIRSQLAKMMQIPASTGEIAEVTRATALLRSVRIRLVNSEGTQIVDADPDQFDPDPAAPNRAAASFNVDRPPDAQVLAALGRALEAEKTREKSESDDADQDRYTSRTGTDTGTGNGSSEDGGVPADAIRVDLSDEGDLGYLILSDAPDFSEPVMQAAGVGFAVAAIGSVLASILLGLIVGRKLTGPIADLAGVVRQMGRGALSERAVPVGSDEISQLAVDVNTMAGNLELAVTNLERERDTLKQFVADASHELRTPITAISNFNELLGGPSGERPERRSEFLSESRVQIERMKRIINELIELSRLDAGMVRLNLEPTNISTLVEGARELMPGGSKEIAFDVDPHGAETDFLCDAGRMTTVFRNLFENAVRAMDGKGRIDVSATHEDGRVEISVADHGPGVDAEQLPHLFRRFYRPPSAKGPGSGLGLAIVKSVVESHGGTVEVDNRSDRSGLEFRLTIPRTPVR